MFCVPCCCDFSHNTSSINVCQACICIDGSVSIGYRIWVGLCTCMSKDGIGGSSNEADLTALHGNSLDGSGSANLDGTCVERALGCRLSAVECIIEGVALHRWSSHSKAYALWCGIYTAFRTEDRSLDSSCGMCQGYQLAVSSELVGCTILRQVTINDHNVADGYG